MRTIVVGHSRSRQAALRRDKTVDPPPRLFMPADVEGFTRVWRDPAGKPAFYAEAWGATGGTGEYAWDKSGFRLICRAKTLLTFLEAQDACLVLLVKAQKYLKDAGTTDGKFAESTLLMTIMPSGGIEFVLQIPDNARTAIETLGRDEQHDFVRRFEAIRLAAIERSI